MHLMFSIFHTEPKSWTGCLPPSNDERRGAWAQRYYSEGHHNPEPVDVPDHHPEELPQ